MNIALVTSNYPYPNRPYCGAFVRELAWEFSRQGHSVTVVAPVTVWDRFRFGSLGPEDEMERVKRSDAVVRVLRPRILSASAVQIFGLNTLDVSDFFFTQAVVRACRGLTPRPDVIYAHFLYPGGRAAGVASRSLGVPYVVAHGDFEIDPLYLSRGASDFRDVAGVIAVSTRNALFCKSVFGIPEEKVTVLPNGIDTSLFFPRDRVTARAALGLPGDTPLVAFVGRFDAAKGPDRLARALESCGNAKLILIGEGSMPISSDRIAFRGVVDHEQLPYYLSAADLFALPTTGEGSCNAILEAMACGLPIVSSLGDFNDDILNTSVAVRIDPLSIDALSDAISRLLLDAERRRRMSSECIRWTREFDVGIRARKVSAFMEERVSTLRSRQAMVTA